MLPLKHFREQQRVQRPASMHTHCHAWGNCSLALAGGMVHRTQQPQRGSDEICHAQTQLWFVQNINLVHVAFTNKQLLCAWQDKIGGTVQNYQEHGGKQGVFHEH